ncbi:hypothetical protein AAG906_022713 [Vitis piasezkii]
MRSLQTTYGMTYLHALTSPWLFSVWGIDIIGKISLKSSNGHEFVLIAIDYFTKWVEATSYARLTSARVVIFIGSHIICRYGVPHELISDRGYILERVLPIEIKMGSLSVALEQQIPKADWAQARFDQLNLLDERRLRTADHVGAYQRKMVCAFKKRELTPKGAAWLMDLDENQFSKQTNVDQLKCTISICFICLLIDILYTLGTLNFPSFLSPYHPSLRYVPCLKTTLRPWNQMSSSTASAWTIMDSNDQDYISTDARFDVI